MSTISSAWSESTALALDAKSSDISPKDLSRSRFKVSAGDCVEEAVLIIKANLWKRSSSLPGSFRAFEGLTHFMWGQLGDSFEHVDLCAGVWTSIFSHSAQFCKKRSLIC